MPEHVLPAHPPFVPKRPSAFNRRAWVRFPCDNEATCHPLTASSRTLWWGLVQDISANGLGLVLDRRFEPGKELIVNLQGRAEEFSRSLRVRVAHDTLITASPGLRWLVGCTFVEPLSDQELHDLAAERP